MLLPLKNVMVRWGGIRHVRTFWIGSTTSSPLPFSRNSCLSKVYRYTTLLEVQDTTINKWGDKHFIGDRVGNSSYLWKTYKDFGEDSENLATALHHLGVVAGDSIACISKNRYEWAVGNYASLKLGAKWVPVYENQTSKDWEYIITNSNSKLIFASSPQIAGRLVRHWQSTERDHSSPQTPHIVLFDGPTPETHIEDAVLPNVVNYEDLMTLSMEKGPRDTQHRANPDDVATIIYTSGTTGLPKGVMLSHRNIVHNLKAMKITSSPFYNENTVHCALLPWAHAYGQTVELHQAINNGASIGTSSPQTIVDDLQLIQPTILVGVPALFGRLYDSVTTKLETVTGVQKSIADAALATAQERRDFLDSAEGLGQSTPGMLRLRWWLANATAIKNIRKALGGKLEVCMTGGAALDPKIQYFFTDLGVRT